MALFQALLATFCLKIIDFHPILSSALRLDGGVQVISLSEAGIEPSLNVIPTLKTDQNRLHLQPNPKALFDSSSNLRGQRQNVRRFRCSKIDQRQRVA